MNENELVGVYEASRPQAEAVAAALRGAGVHAEVFGGLETSWHPGLADGARVVVGAKDAARALEIVTDLES